MRAAEHAQNHTRHSSFYRETLKSAAAAKARQKLKILSGLIIILLQAQRSLGEHNRETEFSSCASTYRNSSLPDLPLLPSPHTPEIQQNQAIKKPPGSREHTVSFSWQEAGPWLTVLRQQHCSRAASRAAGHHSLTAAGQHPGQHGSTTAAWQHHSLTAAGQHQCSTAQHWLHTAAGLSGFVVPQALEVQHKRLKANARPPLSIPITSKAIYTVPSD